jgi:hypothetical protein
MTKEEFEQFKKDFKDEWEELAKYSKSEKSIRVEKYLNRCPACHIAAWTSNYHLSKDSYLGYNRFLDNHNGLQNCKFCPIIIWRDKARINEDYVIGDSICMKENELYMDWNRASSHENKSELANQIAELEWKWLKEYENI